MENSAINGLYSPLDSHRREIRLVILTPGERSDPIRCTLEQTSLDDSPKYEALSYVWGDPSNPVPIFLDSQDFPVTRNLGQALEHLRYKSRDRTLWIDAICINQEDLDERSAQVQLMRWIYNDAEQVVSWLGPAKLETADAAWFLYRTIQRNFSPNFIMHAALSDPECIVSLVRHLDGNSCYWTRLWITQEVGVAKDGVLKCGDYKLPYWALRRFGAAFKEAISGNIGKLVPLCGIPFTAQIFDLSLTFTSNEVCGMASPGQPLLELLVLNRRKRASDPRDKIFGLLGLSDLCDNPHPGLKIDYQRAVKDVYIGVVHAVVDETSKLDIICSSYGARGSDLSGAPDTGLQNLPTWAPDWSIDHNRTLSLDSVKKPSKGASGDTLTRAKFFLDRGILSVTGFCVGIVKHCCSSSFLRREWGGRSYQDVYEIVVQWHKHLRGNAPGYNPKWDEIFVNTITVGLETMHFADGLLPQATDDPTAHIERVLSGDGGNQSLVHQTILERIDTYCSQMLFFLVDRIGNRPHGQDTATPMMGVAPLNVKSGDRVCVFLGCGLPVIIRPDRHLHQFVGAAYIDSLINGEAIEGLESGMYNLETFLLA